MKKFNIVFVCTGNTCRSPMAEAIFRDRISDYSEFCEVSSCGLAAAVGSPAGVNAVTALNEIGIDISSHRSRQMNMYIIEQADLLVCLSESHKMALLPYAPNKTVLLGSGVPDPYGGNLDIYRKCRDKISVEIEHLLTDDLLFSVDRTEEEDISEIAKIERENFSEPWSENSFREQINKGFGVCYTGKYLGKPVAYVNADLIAGEMNICNIAVEKSMRNRGYGSKIMKRLIDKCTEENCNILTLEVRKSNVAAINMYKKFGLVQVGVRKNFYRKPVEDGIIMTREFSINENIGN